MKLLFKFLLIYLVSSPAFLNAQDWSLSGNGSEVENAVLGSNAEYPVNFITNGQQRMTINKDGLVGIGTTIPYHQLTIYGATSPKNVKPKFRAPSTESVLQIINDDSGSGLGKGLLLSLSGETASLRSDFANKLLFKIGESSVQLNDNNTLNLFGGIFPAGSRLNLYAGSDNGFYIKKSSEGYAMKLVNNSTTADAIQVSTSSNLDDINFVVQHTGRTGIGTSTPSEDYMLDVAGKVRACEVVVSNPGWCDYVFEDDYELMSLTEVKSFIKKNKHLPHVPSEATVEAEGVSLAEMNAVLLRKVEELMLYTLKQEELIQQIIADQRSSN